MRVRREDCRRVGGGGREWVAENVVGQGSRGLARGRGESCRRGDGILHEGEKRLEERMAGVKVG
jgi:hypothetical protein